MYGNKLYRLLHWILLLTFIYQSSIIHVYIRKEDTNEVPIHNIYYIFSQQITFK
jgi:hypothetical protein